MRKIIIAILTVTVFNYFPLLHALTHTKTENSLAEIENKIGNITLERLYTWGDSEESGHIFKTPTDIAVNHKNHYYIVDSALHCINVFDSNRKFIRKIGQPGQGPNDLLSPLHLSIDSNNRIWVFEAGNRRIQVFSETGGSLAILKVKQRMTSNLVFPQNNQIAFYNGLSAQKGEGLISVIDIKGITKTIIGQHMLLPRINLPFAGGKYDYCDVSFNEKTNVYYLSYKYSQMIQLFNKDGDLKSCIFYETPLDKLKLEWDPARKNYDLTGKKDNYSECVDSGTGVGGRLFIVISTRLPKENEGKSMLFYPGGQIVYTPRSKNYPEKTDMYRLMVFGTDGKIQAANQLDVFCDEIYIHKNRIFIIDKTFAQKIYEFKYNIKIQAR